MFLPYSLPSRWLIGCAAVVLALVSARAARAQAKPSAENSERLLPARDFTRTMEKEFLKLVRSDVEIELDDKTKEIIDLAAQYYPYRFTWLEVQKQQPSPGKLDIAKVFGDLEGFLRDFEDRVRKGVRNEKVRQRFLEKLTASLKEILTKPQERIARVNAARALALVAESGYENVADVLLEVLQDDKQNDGVRYWALVGMKELFNSSRRPEGAPLKNKEREAACILALMKTVDMKGPPMNAAREQVEGFRLLRREAVRALALSGKPVLADEKAKTVKARPALTLLRVLARPDGFSPEARFDEQLEAAVGLARIETKGVPDYQPDYAAAHIARFVVKLAERYQDKAVKDAESEQVYAARLGEALEGMKADAMKNVKDKEVKDYVSTVVDKAGPVLRNVEKGTAPQAQDLLVWLNNSPGKSTMLYRDVPESEIKPAAEKTEDPAPEKKDEPKK